MFITKTRTALATPVAAAGLAVTAAVPATSQALPTQGGGGAGYCVHDGVVYSPGDTIIDENGTVLVCQIDGTWKTHWLYIVQTNRAILPPIGPIR
jgi:hypothetical protein